MMLESNSTSKTSQQQLLITPVGSDYLLSTAKWSYFIAILGFILTIFLFVVGIATFFLSNVANEYSDFQNILLALPFPFLIGGSVYLLLAVLYFIPSYYLFKFSQKIQNGIKENKINETSQGLRYLNRLFSYIGVLSILSIALGVILPLSILIGVFLV